MSKFNIEELKTIYKNNPKFGYINISFPNGKIISYPLEEFFYIYARKDIRHIKGKFILSRQFLGDIAGEKDWIILYNLYIASPPLILLLNFLQKEVNDILNIDLGKIRENILEFQNMHSILKYTMNLIESSSLPETTSQEIPYTLSLNFEFPELLVYLKDIFFAYPRKYINEIPYQQENMGFIFNDLVYPVNTFLKYFGSSAINSKFILNIYNLPLTEAEGPRTVSEWYHLAHAILQPSLDEAKTLLLIEIINLFHDIEIKSLMSVLSLIRDFLFKLNIIWSEQFNMETMDE